MQKYNFSTISALFHPQLPTPAPNFLSNILACVFFTYQKKYILVEEERETWFIYSTAMGHEVGCSTCITCHSVLPASWTRLFKRLFSLIEHRGALAHIWFHFAPTTLYFVLWSCQCWLTNCYCQINSSTAILTRLVKSSMTYDCSNKKQICACILTHSQAQKKSSNMKSQWLFKRNCCFSPFSRHNSMSTQVKLCICSKAITDIARSGQDRSAT